ncbi:NADH-quinone oxidoreductase subunit J [Alicyclobacillus cellulosilyticus]|nr:NADH-quinone oxidoreductase subunit J [Alicyclobacillus cellulosilyticus]
MQILWTPEMIAFFLISLAILACAVMLLSFQKVIYMALAIGGVFIGCAALYILLGAEFVGISQVLIYAGAITILLMFAIMLTNHEAVEPEARWTVRRVFSALGCLALAAVLWFVIRSVQWPQGDAATDINQGHPNAVAIGLMLFKTYTIPFELVSLLLIVALVGAVILARPPKEGE